MPTTSLMELLYNESKLSRVARLYDENGKLTTEYKTIATPTPDTTECLKKTYIYNAQDKIIGEQSKVTTWTQILEDLVSPPITDIQLSNTVLNPGLPSGTKVGDITVIGGTLPVTVSLSSNPGNLFRIDNGTELTLNAPSSDGNYPIEIQATDDDGKIETQQFTIQVVAFQNAKSLLFDGVDEYINCGNGASFNFSDVNPLFVSAWIKPNKAQFSKIAGKFGVSGKGYCIELQGPNTLRVRIAASGASAIIIDSVLTVTQNQWNHVLFTYDGSRTAAGVKIYVNGTLESSPSVAQDDLGADISNSDNFEIGRKGDAAYFSGNLDEVSVGSKELSASEVAEIYNSGLPTDLLNVSFAANVVSWWSCGDSGNFPTIVDKTGLNNGTAVNMEALDVKDDVPV